MLSQSCAILADLLTAEAHCKVMTDLFCSPFRFRFTREDLQPDRSADRPVTGPRQSTIQKKKCVAVLPVRSNYGHCKV